MYKVTPKQMLERVVRDFVRQGISELTARQLVNDMIYTKPHIILVDTDTEYVVKDRY